MSTHLTDNLQYWVVFAFLTVVESAINAAYWFRTLKHHASLPDDILTL